MLMRTPRRRRLGGWASLDAGLVGAPGWSRHGVPQARLRRAAPFHFAPPGAPHRLRGPLRSFSPPTPASGEPWGFWAVLEAPMVFTFQPPFSAGLSGYCAEIGAGLFCRLDERSDGKEGVSTCQFRLLPFHYKKKK